MTADVIAFPPQGKKCRTCGFIMVPTADQPEYDECHCCRHNIKLPLQFDPPQDPCPECAGSRLVAIHICRDKDECKKSCPKLEPCAACCGTGEKKKA